jgi:hypothetical protein
MQFAIFSVLVFQPAILKTISPKQLVLIKLSTLTAGVLCGMGLEKSILRMEDKKEKVAHCGLVLAIVGLAALSLNMKIF